MPQLQNLVLTDRTSPTPVDVTFVPQDIVDGVATVVNQPGVPLGARRVSLSLRRTKDNGRYRGTLKYSVPVVSTVGDVTTVLRTGYAELSFTFDPGSSEQERKDLVGFVQSSLDTSEALTNDMLVKLQGVY